MKWIKAKTVETVNFLSYGEYVKKLSKPTPTRNYGIVNYRTQYEADVKHTFYLPISEIKNITFGLSYDKGADYGGHWTVNIQLIHPINDKYTNEKNFTFAIVGYTQDNSAETNLIALEWDKFLNDQTAYVFELPYLFEISQFEFVKKSVYPVDKNRFTQREANRMVLKMHAKATKTFEDIVTPISKTREQHVFAQYGFNPDTDQSA